MARFVIAYDESCQKFHFLSRSVKDGKMGMASQGGLMLCVCLYVCKREGGGEEVC